MNQKHFLKLWWCEVFNFLAGLPFFLFCTCISGGGVSTDYPGLVSAQTDPLAQAVCVCV